MILVVCEKPSVGRDIAKVLRANRKGEGYLEGDTHIVSWAFGHLLSPMMPEEIDERWKGWRMDALPILPDQIPQKILPSGKKQFAVLKKLMKDKRVSSIICATDAGREGELIFRRIYEQAGCKKPIQRLWISSMTEEAIQAGFEALQPSQSYDLLYKSAKCRADADWLVGMNGSRAFTIRYNALLSVGRVQTPTLALLVSRKKEIERFVPEDYFEVEADFSQYKGIYVKNKQTRLKTKEEAQQIAKQLQGKTGTIQSVKREVKKQAPPLLYDLTTLQREANARFGLTAAATLKIAQALYETHKVLTYPRTDSRHLSNDMKPQVQALLRKLPENYQSLLPQAPQNPGKRMFNDEKLTDHHAIIPTGRKPSSLSDVEQKVYDLVVRRLIAGFCEDYSYESIQVITKVEEHDFQTSGKTVLNEGWTAVSPPIRSAKEENDALPNLLKGQTYAVKGAKVLSKQTKPPAQYTENTLLDAMEHAGRFVTDEALREQLKERGLGTPATRASIIERLIEVKYVKREKRNLVATEKGQKLIEVAPEQLISAETTGKWEKGLKDIERGRLSPERFMDSIRRYSLYLVEEAKKAPPMDFPREESRKRAPARRAAPKKTVVKKK